MENSGYAIRRLAPAEIRAAAPALGAVLIDCVKGGASVGFLDTIDAARAEGFWRGVADSAERDKRAVIVAEGPAAGIVGTVQMVPAGPENQPHRADVSKMLVLRAHRRKGLGAALMRAAEAEAARAGKTLLTLDTATDDAERLYEALGWVRAGRIPNYALMPDGSPCATVLFYKDCGVSRK